jgi:hypothetical protein
LVCGCGQDQGIGAEALAIDFPSEFFPRCTVRSVLRRYSAIAFQPSSRSSDRVRLLQVGIARFVVTGRISFGVKAAGSVRWRPHETNNREDEAEADRLLDKLIRGKMSQQAAGHRRVIRGVVN